MQGNEWSQEPDICILRKYSEKEKTEEESGRNK